MLSLSLFFLSIFTTTFQHCNSRIFTFEMHHRYSDHVINTLQPLTHINNSKTHQYHHHNYPQRGSYEYYSDLATRDRIFHRRKISEIEEPVTFSDGNSTFRISSLGFLHYTTVTVGTPGTKFLVALDTGSDLFWVPCECTRCAPIQGTTYGNDFELSIYSPKASTTSKKVACNNSLCLHHSTCMGEFSQCPYVISYVSADTSTSGVLVEDALHLTTEDRYQESVMAYITFGCGQVQTGSFLDVAAPNGLFGLGMENISVPSTLAREGFTADSFSMCFGRDGVGRISFGDKGTHDQKETPFNLNPLHPTYNITVTGIAVGTAVSDLEFSALFDSGTSFTYLVDPAYTILSGSFHSQIKDKRRPPDSRIPFQYCYDMRPDGNASSLPSLSLKMKGGHEFTVGDPIIVISTQGESVYCLAVIRSPELNIIGQNFMTGYRIVFDREKFILGWQSSDCYNIQVLSSSVGDNDSLVPAAVAAQPDNTTADVDRGSSHGLTSSPAIRCCSLDIIKSFMTVILAAFSIL